MTMYLTAGLTLVTTTCLQASWRAMRSWRGSFRSSWTWRMPWNKAKPGSTQAGQMTLACLRALPQQARSLLFIIALLIHPPFSVSISILDASSSTRQSTKSHFITDNSSSSSSSSSSLLGLCQQGRPWPCPCSATSRGTIRGILEETVEGGGGAEGGEGGAVEAGAGLGGMIDCRAALRARAGPVPRGDDCAAVSALFWLVGHAG